MNVRIGGNSFSAQRSCKKCGGRMRQVGDYYQCKKCGNKERDEETQLEKNLFRKFSYGGRFWF